MYTNSEPGRKVPAGAERGRGDAGLGMLVARLMFAVQDELYQRLAAAGYDDLRPNHGVVMAYLDHSGTRATDLATRSGRQKQLIGRVVDELEVLGYVERCPDPADRRAKLVVPTERGRAAMNLSDKIMKDLEGRESRAIGPATYEEFRQVLGRLIESIHRHREVR
ncbi:MAG TPA: MarR family winged helix-turn-helix transcriptional regulator [Nonomuraea sp.]|nr:MarR family winged helix-turn-helix transcriptional regulator [Nonomuraea sp.]